jgi:alkylation response protein AidB-like acyl-CoA dehydrogenase
MTVCNASARNVKFCDLPSKVIIRLMPTFSKISMNFDLSDEQQAFADSVRRFARDKLAPGALARAHSSAYPWDVARMLAEQGLLGITFAEADGGQGGSLMHAVLAIQEVALVCPKSADIVQAGNFGPIRTFVEYATPEQKARFLPDLLAGRKLIALGMSEPDAGSAVTELRTSARFDGDALVINGSKVFSTHSPEADLFLVYVRFGPGLGGIGSVLVERETSGFSIGAPSSFMSGEQWCQLYFEECSVPRSNVLLGEGGFKKQISGFNVERLGNSSRSLALGRHAFNLAREHATQRKQFGRQLCEFQGLQWKFADMALKLESAQLLLYRAALEAAHGLPSAHSTALAKLACNLAGWEVANEALQIMGGLGYSRESMVEYCVRRIRGWMIAGGSIEMLKNKIAEGVFERTFSQRIAMPK